MIAGLVSADLAYHFAASAALIGVALPLRAGLARRARLNEAGDSADRIARIRRFAGIGLALSLALVWSAEIQSLLWSLTAVAVALVVATKELIQCGTGALFRAAGRSLKVGDRIEIDGVHGEIVDKGFLTTTLAECERGPAGRHLSGRMVVVPNSRLFSADVRIEHRDAATVLHRFHMIFEPSVSAQAAVCVADAIVDRLAPLSGRHAVGLSTTEMAKIRLEVALVCPPANAVDLERAVKMEFLEWLWAQAQARQAKTYAERYAAGNDATQRAA